MSTMLIAFVMGMLGLIVNGLMVWQSAVALSSFDMRSLFFTAIIPFLFIAVGCDFFEKRDTNASAPQYRSTSEQVAFGLVSGMFTSLAIYLSLVITTVVWSADAAGASLSEFFYGAFNPSSLQSLYEVEKSGRQTEVSWGLITIIGFFMGAIGGFKSRSARD